MNKTIQRRQLPANWHTSLTLDMHPLLRRIYAGRGVVNSTDVDHRLAQLLNYDGLLNVDKAALLVVQILRQQQKILIVGDFDADGATSTAVAVRALKMLGATNVAFLVPNRFSGGYGLTPELVKLSLDFQPELIITVDNGIANHEGVLAAKNAGIKVIITDHHLPSATLPVADVIVNPNQYNDTFPSKNLAGVGVIFYVMLAVRRQLQQDNWFVSHGLAVPNMSQLLDLVALGTIADLVPLDRNNRVLVNYGLQLIRQQKCVPGITALLAVAGKNQAMVTTSDLAYVVASRLNAAGRLDDMSIGINCLLTDNVVLAKQQALTLDSLNQDRRSIEQEMKSSAFAALDKLNPTVNHGICVFQESWHQGVIGILAARIKDHYHRPTIVFAAGSATELKGSARSIPNVHIRDVLANITVTAPGLIKRFGGHAMAAGLTIQRNDFVAFTRIFNEILAGYLDPAALQNVLYSDGDLLETELTLSIAEMLANSGPWGQAFPEPMFDDVFTVLEQKLLSGKHLKLTLGKGARYIKAIAFNIDNEHWPNYRCQMAHVAYRLDINTYLKQRNLQLIVEQINSVN
jgi:single-stranded-DNA-specific exonuclease